MSNFALYNLLKRIPDVTDEEVERAVADVAKSNEVATKSDLKDLKKDFKSDLKDLELRLTNKMYGLSVGIVATIGLIVKCL